MSPVSISMLYYYRVKYTVNCTTFDIQKCTTLKNKRKTGFSLTKLDQNVQSGYVLYSKNPT